MDWLTGHERSPRRGIDSRPVSWYKPGSARKRRTWAIWGHHAFDMSVHTCYYPGHVSLHVSLSPSSSPLHQHPLCALRALCGYTTHRVSQSHSNAQYVPQTSRLRHIHGTVLTACPKLKVSTCHTMPQTQRCSTPQTIQPITHHPTKVPLYFGMYGRRTGSWVMNNHPTWDPTEVPQNPTLSGNPARRRV